MATTSTTHRVASASGMQPKLSSTTAQAMALCQTLSTRASSWIHHLQQAGSILSASQQLRQMKLWPMSMEYGVQTVRKALQMTTTMTLDRTSVPQGWIGTPPSVPASATVGSAHRIWPQCVSRQATTHSLAIASVSNSSSWCNSWTQMAKTVFQAPLMTLKTRSRAKISHLVGSTMRKSASVLHLCVRILTRTYSVLLD